MRIFRGKYDSFIVIVERMHLYTSRQSVIILIII